MAWFWTAIQVYFLIRNSQKFSQGETATKNSEIAESKSQWEIIPTTPLTTFMPLYTLNTIKEVWFIAPIM